MENMQSTENIHEKSVVSWLNKEVSLPTGPRWVLGFLGMGALYAAFAIGGTTQAIRAQVSETTADGSWKQAYDQAFAYADFDCNQVLDDVETRDFLFELVPDYTPARLSRTSMDEIISRTSTSRLESYNRQRIIPEVVPVTAQGLGGNLKHKYDLCSYEQ